MINKLEHRGDVKLVRILERIFHDEIGHVQIGSYWFNYLCDLRNLPPDETFDQLLTEYMQDASFGAFDQTIRLQAGFSQRELDDLMQRSRKRCKKLD